MLHIAGTSTQKVLGVLAGGRRIARGCGSAEYPAGIDAACHRARSRLSRRT